MKAFGTRPTYQIFAVMTLATGVMYFVFNATYLKRLPRPEGNDIVKKKPKSADGLEKQQQQQQPRSDDICLDEKPRCERIEGRNEGSDGVTVCGIDNGGFLRESQNRKSQEARESASTETEAAKNAKNIDKTERAAKIGKRESASSTTTGSDAARIVEENGRGDARDKSFVNPSFEADEPERCEIESRRLAESVIDRLDL